MRGNGIGFGGFAFVVMVLGSALMMGTVQDQDTGRPGLVQTVSARIDSCVRAPMGCAARSHTSGGAHFIRIGG